MTQHHKEKILLASQTENSSKPDAEKPATLTKESYKQIILDLYAYVTFYQILKLRLRAEIKHTSTTKKLTNMDLSMLCH